MSREGLISFKSNVGFTVYGFASVFHVIRDGEIQNDRRETFRDADIEAVQKRSQICKITMPVSTWRILCAGGRKAVGCALAGWLLDAGAGLSHFILVSTLNFNP